MLTIQRDLRWNTLARGRHLLIYLVTRDFNILIYWQQGVSLRHGSLRSQQWVGKARSGMRPHLWHWFSLGSCFSEPHALDHNKRWYLPPLLRKLICVIYCRVWGTKKFNVPFIYLKKRDFVLPCEILPHPRKYQKSKNFW